ncbi:MAG: glycosyltransferase [Promethearchaeota archaeon]
MLNILVKQDTDWLERGPHQQHHILERMGRKGHSIHVVDFEILWNKKPGRHIIEKKKVFKNVAKVVDCNGIVVTRPPMPRIQLLDKVSVLVFHALEMRKIIKKRKIQVIIAYGIIAPLIGKLLSRIHKIPLVFHVIDSNFALISDYLPKPFVFLAKIVEMMNIRFSDLIITVNKELKNYVVKMGGKPENVKVLPTGVDLARYRVNDKEIRHEMRKKYGIRDDDLVLFFMGWLYSFSGLKELADYMIKHPEFNIKLFIVGNGDLFKYLKERSRISNDIILTGRVPFDRIPDYLALSDVCILPSRKNKIMMHIVPIKLYEYMAAGKPIIATNLPGIRQEFGENNGILYSNSIEELVQIALDLKNNGTISSVGKLSLNFIKKYDWNNIVEKFERLLYKLIKR